MDYNHLDPKTNPFVYNTNFPQRFIFIVIFLFLGIIFLSFVTVLQFQKYISSKIAYISTNFKHIKRQKNKKNYLLQKQQNNDISGLNSSNLMLLQSSSSNVNISPLADLYLDKLDYERIKSLYNQNSSQDSSITEKSQHNSINLLKKYHTKSSSELDDIKEEETSNDGIIYNVDTPSAGAYFDSAKSDYNLSNASGLSINIIEPIFTPDKLKKGPSLRVISNSNSSSANSIAKSPYQPMPKSASPLKKQKTYFVDMNILPGSMSSKEFNVNPFEFRSAKSPPKVNLHLKKNKTSELKAINEMDPNDLLFEVLNHK